MSSGQQLSNNTGGLGPSAFKDIDMSSDQPYVDANGQFHNVGYIHDDMTLDPRLSNTAGDMSGNMATDIADQQMLNFPFWNPNINNQTAFFDNRVPGANGINSLNEDNQMVAPEVITPQRTTIKTRSPSERSDPTPRTRSMTSSRSSVPLTNSASSRSSVPSTNSAPSDRNQKPRKESRKGKQQAPRQRKQSNASVSSRKKSLPEEEEMLREDDTRRDRFLERNRIAASKCRQKKKVWVHDLEGSKQELENQNNNLHLEHNALVSELTRMKNVLMLHARCHDPNIDQWIDNEARKFVQNTAERFSATGAPEPALRAPRYTKRGE